MTPAGERLLGGEGGNMKGLDSAASKVIKFRSLGPLCAPEAVALVGTG